MKTTIKRLLPAKCRPVVNNAFLSGRGVLYRGSSVHCPCCGGSFRHFLPGGYNYRPNVKCPRCNSAERHRHLCLFFARNPQILRNGITLLHVAPELSISQKLRKYPTVNYISADLVRPAMVQMDITDIRYDNASFDAILCSHVLEHIPDDRRAMTELFRVLKPGGWAILQVPIDYSRSETYEDPQLIHPDELMKAFGHHDHRRIYGMDYADRLRSAGFKVEIIEFSKMLDQTELVQFGLPEDENIYFCKKLI